MAYSAKQERIQIILEWLEQGRKGLGADTNDALRDMTKAYKDLRGNLDQIPDRLGNVTEKQELLESAYESFRIGMFRNVNAYGKLFDQMGKLKQQRDKEMQGAAKWLKQLGAMGFKLSWFGFRLTSMGKMFIGIATGPIRMMSSQFEKMDQTMESLAMTIGLTEAGFGDAGVPVEDMRATLQELPLAALEIQTAMGGVRAALTQLAIDNAPELIKIFHALIDVINGAGGAFITGLIGGIASAAPFIGKLMIWLRPLGGFLGHIAGILALLAPLFIAVGSALFFIGPIATMVTTALGTTVGIIMAIITAIVTLLTYVDDFANFLKNLGSWLGFGGGGYQGAAGGSGGVEATIYNEYNIEGGVNGNVDLGAIEDASSRGTASALGDKTW